MAEFRNAAKAKARDASQWFEVLCMLKFVAGLAVGYGIGLLIAPATGDETRKNLIERAREVAAYPQKKANELLDAVPDKAAQIAAETARKAAQEAVEKVRDKTGLQPTGTDGRA